MKIANRSCALIFRLLCLMVFEELAAQPPQSRLDETEKRVAALEERLKSLEEKISRLIEHQPAGSSASRVDEPKKEQIQARTPEASPPMSASPPQDSSQTPLVEDAASSEITHIPYAGYMEIHLNKDGVSPAQLDFHRFVLLFGHGFGERIRFWSELELEHAFVEGGEEGGEVALEQAYLDFLIHPALNLRAGMLLSPVGIINERHEPPSFNGVERPFVDTFIIPSTWFGSGAGVVGDLGRGFAYRIYSMTSLNAAGFSAEEGFRGGRQQGFLENARNMSFAGRLEFRGVPGLNLGTSFWTGRTGFDLRGVKGQAQILEFDGRFRRSHFDARAQFAFTHLDSAGEINRAVRRQTGVNPNVAESMRGFYLEGAGHMLPLRAKHDLVAFYRYENFDTQRRMPRGFLPLKQFDRQAHIVGLGYYPYPDIAFKLDYNFMRSASEVFTPSNRLNFGIGWWF